MLVLAGFLSAPATAQIFQDNSTTNAPGDEPPDDSDPDPTVPFDGGITLLLAAGAAYGVKRIRDQRKKRNNPSVAKDESIF